MAVPPLGDHLTFVKLFSFVKFFFFGGGRGVEAVNQKNPKKIVLYLRENLQLKCFVEMSRIELWTKAEASALACSGDWIVF